MPSSTLTCKPFDLKQRSSRRGPKSTASASPRSWILSQNPKAQSSHEKTSGKPKFREVLQNTNQYSSKFSRS
eukprot:NP_001265431.1 putative uncharacterized protein C1orf195 isoform 2 [Homo sapiens]